MERGTKLDAIETRRDILDIIAARPGISIIELARAIGQGTTSTHYHVTYLRNAGVLSPGSGVRTLHVQQAARLGGVWYSAELKENAK